jgi:hypothetical protein
MDDSSHLELTVSIQQAMRAAEILIGRARVSEETDVRIIQQAKTGIAESRALLLRSRNCCDRTLIRHARSLRCRILPPLVKYSNRLGYFCRQAS